MLYDKVPQRGKEDQPFCVIVCGSGGGGSLYNCGRNVPIKVGVSFYQSVLNPGDKSDRGIGMLLRGSYRS